MVYWLMCLFKACKTEIRFLFGYVSHLGRVRTEIRLLFARITLLYLFHTQKNHQLFVIAMLIYKYDIVLQNELAWWGK
jgi:hypothetical protein